MPNAASARELPTPSRCAYVTAANVRCRRDKGHAGAHDTLYIFDALPDRPEPVSDPLPEDLERLLRNPRISIPGDEKVHALIVADLEQRPEQSTVPRDAYLSLYALYERTVRDGGQ